MSMYRGRGNKKKVMVRNRLLFRNDSNMDSVDWNDSRSRRNYFESCFERTPQTLVSIWMADILSL